MQRRTSTSYLHFLMDFRRHDLNRFVDEHEKLYQEARLTSDHGQVTRSYYELMNTVIGRYWGDSWHFAPPETGKQKPRAANRALHHKVARILGLGPGQVAIDLGCGIGGAMREVALASGARMAGVTIAPEEVDEANRISRARSMDQMCTVVQGTSDHLPFDADHFDAGYAIYSLKYAQDLQPIFADVRRVLKPGGFLLVYDIVKTELYDASNPQHCRLVGGFEYACGMPPIHTVEDMLKDAELAGLECISQLELSQHYPWYHHWVRNRVFMWTLYSRRLHGVFALLERGGILPRGFDRFVETFVSGTIRSLIEAGQQGILTGSRMLVFRNPHGLQADSRS